MTEKVTVALRIRPPLTKEETKHVCITPVDARRVCVGTNRIFSLDHVYDAASDTATIFSERIKPLIDGFLNGYNATVMAYGQTGTGKTHTVNTLAPLVVEYMTEKMHGLDKVSFQLLEVYGESLHDLLAPTVTEGSPPKALHLLEGQSQTHVVGATRVKVANLEEAQSLLDHGKRLRTTAATAMNALSSRSHCILSIIHHDKLCKFHLVDLAGSERNKKTHNVGLRFKESVGINTGLLALGNVIRALVAQSNFIPYRVSKLTRLLQDSLGGNSRTLFLACVAPDASNLDETVRTLQYSCKAMHILNEPLPNMDVLQAQHQKQLQRLQAAHDLSCEEVLQQYANGDEFAMEQAAEIERLTTVVNDLEKELRAAKSELKKDEVIFAGQLKELQRVTRENKRLRERVEMLEAQDQWLADFRDNHRATSTSPPLSSHSRAMRDDAVIDAIPCVDAIGSMQMQAAHHASSSTSGVIQPKTPVRTPDRHTDVIPDYVSLYSLHASQAPSAVVAPTPISSKTPYEAGVTTSCLKRHDHRHNTSKTVTVDVATAARPSRVATPHTENHLVAQVQANHVSMGCGMSPAPRGCGPVTPIRMKLSDGASPYTAHQLYSPEDEMTIWTNAFAEELATNDVVTGCTPVIDTDDDVLQQPSFVAQQPMSRNTVWFHRGQTRRNSETTFLSSPRVSVIIPDATTHDISSDALLSEKRVDEILRDSLRLQQINSELKSQLEGVLHYSNNLSHENVTLKRELHQISEMLRT